MSLIMQEDTSAHDEHTVHLYTRAQIYATGQYSRVNGMNTWAHLNTAGDKAVKNNKC